MTWDFGTVRRSVPQVPAVMQQPPRTAPSAPHPASGNLRSHDYAARPQANGATPAFAQPTFPTVRREPEPTPVAAPPNARHAPTASDDSVDDDQSILESVVLPALDGVRPVKLRIELTCTARWPLPRVEHAVGRRPVARGFHRGRAAGAWRRPAADRRHH